MKDGVSLQIIMKDEIDKVIQLIREAKDYVDAINITVSDKKAYQAIKNNNFAKFANFEQRDWTDDFAEARNANWAMCRTKYGFWLDADDKFDFGYIPKLVDLAEEGYEAIYLPYNYARDEHGRVVAVHWRERLIRADIGFEWRGALHETLIIDRQFSAKKLNEPAVEHDSPDIATSIERNHKILESKVVNVANPDARYVHYLGLSYFTKGDYENAIKTLQRYVEVGGWDEEVYRSYIKMSEAASLLDDPDQAAHYALLAAGILPAYPQAYFCLAQYEFAAGNWEECLEWLKVAFGKPQPKTMSVIDPTMVERGKVIGASSEFQLGHYRDAEALLKSADDPTVEDLKAIFELEASKERFIEIAPAITKHTDKKKLWDSLKEDLQYDQRLQWLRYAANEPRKWPKKSIVWFCGQGFEEWGPHTLENGMGGSEEAVVYLSREMTKLGHRVTVYGAVNEQVLDYVKKDSPATYVEYLPWRMFDTRDEFDTLIVWRAPHGIDKLNARVKILDVHDKLEQKDLTLYPGVKYAFKSNYHRNLYPHIPDKQALVIGNGINKFQFKETK